MHAAQEACVRVVCDVPLALHEVALVHAVHVREGHFLRAWLLLLQVGLWLGQHLWVGGVSEREQAVAEALCVRYV